MTNAFRLSLGIAGAALLIGCDKADPVAANAAVVAAANTATPVVNTATPAATPAAAAGALSADFMVGKWSAMGTCGDTIEFRKDGSVATPIGPGKWSLTGDQLLITPDGADKQKPSTVARVDDKTISITSADGKAETQHRC